MDRKTSATTRPTCRRAIAPFAAALFVLGSGWLTAADAQFGYVRLPKDDFTWQWGDFDENTARRRPDVSAQGSEGGFRCELTARLRPARNMDHGQIRDLERSLVTSLNFIQAAAQLMNSLEYSFDLEWGRLECARHQSDPDAEKQQEQLDRAVERAEREREKRRARRER